MDVLLLILLTVIYVVAVGFIMFELINHRPETRISVNVLNIFMYIQWKYVGLVKAGVVFVKDSFPHAFFLPPPLPVSLLFAVIKF